MNEKATHVEAAEGRLDRAVELARDSAGEDTYIPTALAEAQVHATLAVAEEIRAFRELMGRSAK